MTDFVFTLAEFNIFHSDLKPDNFVLKKEYVDHFIIKIVDVGCASFSFEKLGVYTKNYNCASFSQKEKKTKIIKYSSIEERISAELYSIGKTLFEICCYSLNFDGTIR